MALDYTHEYGTCVTLLEEHLKGDRLDHSRRVEKRAIDLAHIHGVDEAKAGLAGLLHDIAKQFDKKENEKIKRRYGVTSPVEKTLHAPVAAAWLRHHEYVTDPDVLSAIRYHTTGRSSMSMLEKIVYLADATEPGRMYPGVDQLRHLSETDLDEAMLFNLKRSIGDLLDRESPIDPDTVDAYNDYLRMVTKVE